MSNWSKQQEENKERKENERTSRETLGKYFYDLSKLSVGAMVLGVVVPWFIAAEDERYLVLLLIGVMATIVFAISGYRTIKI